MIWLPADRIENRNIFFLPSLPNCLHPWTCPTCICHLLTFYVSLKFRKSKRNFLKAWELERFHFSMGLKFSMGWRCVIIIRYTVICVNKTMCDSVKNLQWPTHILILTLISVIVLSLVLYLWYCFEKSEAETTVKIGCFLQSLFQSHNP